MMPILFALVALLGLGRPAQAGVSVVHGAAEPGDVALSKVVVNARLAIEHVRPQHFQAWAAGEGPVLSGGGTLQGCQGAPVSSPALDGRLQEVRQALAYLELEKALAIGDALLASLPCLTEPAVHDTLAQSFFLVGIAAHGLGDRPRAWDSFSWAHSLDPDMAWDSNYPPDSKPDFEATRLAQTSVDGVWLGLSPLAAGFNTWVDGHAVPNTAVGVTVAPGWHLVQVSHAGMTSMLVHLRAGGSAHVIMPRLMDDGDLAWARDPVRQPLLVAALQAMDLGREVYVSLPEGDLWHVDTVTASWTQMAGTPPHAAMDAATPAPRQAHDTRWLALQPTLRMGGFTVAATSSAWAILGWRQGLALEDEILGGEDTPDSRDRYDALQVNVRMGWTLAGLGLATAGASWLIADAGMELRAQGTGLSLTLRR
jgi:hypothetical protein